MKKCPKCNSTKVSRIPNDYHKGKRDHAGHAIVHSYRSGHPIIAAIGLGFKVAKETGLLDWIDSSFFCDSCGHSF